MNIVVSILIDLIYQVNILEIYITLYNIKIHHFLYKNKKYHWQISDFKILLIILINKNKVINIY